MTTQRRAPDEAQNEQQRPAGEGRPPRPSTEPPGSEGSTRTDRTATDPATGEPTGNPPEWP
jgi:hypothetical protein